MNKMSIRKDDTVIVLSGKDKGKQGKVLEVMPKEGKVVAPIYACKVQRVCPKCNKPTRPAHKLLADGKKVRICKKCGAEI